MSHIVNIVPFFYGTNYGYWKARMRLFLKSLEVWFVIESRWIAPAKPTAEWSKLEKETSKANDKAMRWCLVKAFRGVDTMHICVDTKHLLSFS